MVSPNGSRITEAADCMNQSQHGVVIYVRVIPRSSRDQVSGVREGRLVVKLTAPPVDGKANKGLVKILAKTLQVAASAITIQRGVSSREKTLVVQGTDVETARAALGITGP